MKSEHHGRHAARQRSIGPWLVALFCMMGAFAVRAGEGSDPSILAEARQRVAAASERSTRWNGPQSGPAAVPDQNVAVVCEDLRNGGILSVAQGVREAAKAIGWNVRIFDASGTPDGRNKAAADALATRPNGVILVGADAAAMQSRLLPFAARGIPIVGWHVAAKAGVMTAGPVAVNVSTDPLEVARVTAMAAVSASGGHAGVVIFTDSNFAIASTKAEAMAEVVRACSGCILLEVRDVAISRAAGVMPELTRQLLAHYGKRWTHALAINDIYFDYAVPELTQAGIAADGLSLMSAGDGSAAAFLRIQAGTFQVATVAEPLNLHGWQLVDELNRLLAHRPVSGYIEPVHLVTRQNVAFDGGNRLQYDPDNDYRGAYRHIWKR